MLLLLLLLLMAQVWDCAREKWVHANFECVRNRCAKGGSVDGCENGDGGGGSETESGMSTGKFRAFREG